MEHLSGSDIKNVERTVACTAQGESIGAICDNRAIETEARAKFEGVDTTVELDSNTGRAAESHTGINGACIDEVYGIACNAPPRLPPTSNSRVGTPSADDPQIHQRTANYQCTRSSNASNGGGAFDAGVAVCTDNRAAWGVGKYRSVAQLQSSTASSATVETKITPRPAHAPRDQATIAMSALQQDGASPSCATEFVISTVSCSDIDDATTSPPSDRSLIVQHTARYSDACIPCPTAACGI
ncbi:hypothetical protein D3C77_337900 [compost metagenome]